MHLVPIVSGTRFRSLVYAPPIQAMSSAPFEPNWPRQRLPGVRLPALKGHSGRVIDLAFSHRGSLLARRATLRLLSPPKGPEGEAEWIGFTPDGAYHGSTNVGSFLLNEAGVTE